jgi:hypothetical protein
MKNTIENIFLKNYCTEYFTQWHTRCSTHKSILSVFYTKCHHVMLGTRRYVFTESPFILSVCAYHTRYSIVPSVFEPSDNAR